MRNYEYAKAKYAEFGVDTELAIETLKNVTVSIHCWQGDDVGGFDNKEALSGGIQATGNYPGKATTPEQLMADIDEAFALIPGKKKLNLHACYAILEDGETVGRDALEPKHYKRWVEFAKERGMGIDFNPTFFAHPMMKDGLSLSSPDEATRKFWVKHGKACLEIAAEMGKAMGTPCMVNIWIPDGYKDIPADRLSPRVRLKKSLDEILENYDKEWVIPAVESKVFGIGLESYTVGSNEFYQNYAASKGICCLLDTGHYHPTEVVSDKIPSLLAFYDNVALHISRPVRWDSDHVVILDDELREIAKEIVRDGNEKKVLIGVDYFDASINRLCAWVTGVRSIHKALLSALLLPAEELKALQNEANFTKILYLNEKFKMLPLSDVWNEYLERQNLSDDWFDAVEEFEKEVISKRI